MGKKSGFDGGIMLYRGETCDFHAYLDWQRRLLRGDTIPEKFELDLENGSGFFFGRKTKLNACVGKPMSEDGHILTVSEPSRGKTQAIVIPTMLTWRGSQIILDVKGDLLTHWLELNRDTGKKYMEFRPGAPGDYGCRYDPFAPLRYGGEDNLVRNTKTLVQALVPLSASAREPIWTETAQCFLTGAILYYYNLGLPFAEAMACIVKPPAKETILTVLNSEDEVAKIYMSKLSEVQEKVLGNIGMELAKLGDFIAIPAIRNAFSPDEEHQLLDWAEFNTMTEPKDVFLTIPETDLESLAPMVRVMVNQLIATLEQRPQRTYQKKTELPPILIQLDELPRIGKVPALVHGLATLRSRGISFALFIQSLSQLDERYGVSAARTICGNCSYKVILGASDVESQKYFSNLVGTTMSMQSGFGASYGTINGDPIGYSRNINQTYEPIIFPHEFQTMNDVVVITPDGYFRVEKTMFFKNKELFLRVQRQRAREEELRKRL